MRALDGQQAPTGAAWDGPPPDLERAQTVEKGHGRIEMRCIATTREIVPYLDWPGLAQVCRIERTREVAGRISREVVYAVTSLGRERAGPDALLALVRRHWSIENRLHWRRDAILREDASRIRSGAAPLREDASRIRSGAAPQALAALRNTALRLVSPLPGPLTAIRATFAENRLDAIALAKHGLL